MNPWQALILVNILLACFGAFSLGRNGISSIFPVPHPQPVQANIPIGQPTQAELLTLTINNVKRIPQPKYPNDLVIIEVTFASSSECTLSNCQFRRQNFALILPSGRTLPPAGYPQQYVPEIKLVHLSSQRQLYGNTRETGQIYFLIPKQVTQAQLKYTTASDSPIFDIPLN